MSFKFILFLLISIFACYADDFNVDYGSVLVDVEGQNYRSALSKLNDMEKKYKDYRVFSTKGNILYEGKNFTEAEINFEKAIKLGDNSLNTYKGLAVSLLQQKKYDKLNLYFDDLMNFGQKDEYIFNILIGLAESRNDRDLFFEIIANADEATLSNPKIAEKITIIVYKLAHK